MIATILQSKENITRTGFYCNIYVSELAYIYKKKR